MGNLWLVLLGCGVFGICLLGALKPYKYLWINAPLLILGLLPTVLYVWQLLLPGSAPLRNTVFSRLAFRLDWVFVALVWLPYTALWCGRKVGGMVEKDFGKG